MAHTMCIDCGTRRIRTGPGETAPRGIELCNPCHEFAGWENEHSDYGHDEGVDTDENANCPICHPELDPRTPKRKGHTNTVAKTRTSHAGHHHAVDPQDRAKCRKSIKETGKPYDARKK